MGFPPLDCLYLSTHSLICIVGILHKIIIVELCILYNLGGGVEKAGGMSRKKPAILLYAYPGGTIREQKITKSYK